MTDNDSSAPVFVWGPTIDEAVCTDCRTCLDFCQFGVYAMVDDHVRVAAKASCMAGCSECASMCEAEALTFPTLAELRASRKKV